ncbi:MAG: tRNA (adenosine(37)-N6)-dimethylallyltransferase MiaA [Planctomycetaceae bacterium]|nr:tRNA (adenosine(37)-N6)-dimethylallyltransferase MiaA [Planctomycetaceae bacterium]
MTISPEQLHACWFLAGPTAVGKTALSLLLAEQLNAEIISLDSMAIYRGMDIGTAKPSQAEQARVPHHLIDVIDPHEEFSTSDYLLQAEQAIASILSRGKTPLFVGGTGLYLRSILRGVFAGPPADWELRRELESLERQTPGSLWRELQQRDPQAAQRLHANDLRRVVRALEVCRLTGRPLSEQQQQHVLPREQRPAHVYWLHPPRDWLAARIDLRVERMFEQGLVSEVQQLLQTVPPLGRTATQGLGYKEVIEHLQTGTPLPRTIETVQTRTRQFAKRQHTWFRNLEECQEMAIAGTETSEQLAERLLQQH